MENGEQNDQVAIGLRVALSVFQCSSLGSFVVDCVFKVSLYKVSVSRNPDTEKKKGILNVKFQY